MGSGLSSLFPCTSPSTTNTRHSPEATEPLDETLGHSFRYVRSSNRFLSPTPSDRFVSPTQSFCFSPTRPGVGSETGFKSISGASVSANSCTPRTVLQFDGVHDDATDTKDFVATTTSTNTGIVNVNGIGCTRTFCALPLQPVPRGNEGFFLSGPVALSDPLDAEHGGHVHLSAPLGGFYVKKKKKRKGGVMEIKKAIYGNLSEKKKNQPWVVPVLNRRAGQDIGEERGSIDEGNVQWALGKAGEDRVHVVVSQEHGWLFVGIYDGFNGPDAPEFLMHNLYSAVFNELQGLFWDVEQDEEESNSEIQAKPCVEGVTGTDSNEENGDQLVNVSFPSVDLGPRNDGNGLLGGTEGSMMRQERAKRVKIQAEETGNRQRRRLWEFLAEFDVEDGFDLSGSERFSFSVDEAISLGNAGTAVSRRWSLLKLKEGFSRYRERKLFPWKFGLEGKVEKVDSNRVEKRVLNRKRKVGPEHHQLILRALLRALEVTEFGYLDMTDKVLDTNPELALMGSCLMVVLMRDEHVYVMNVGDSRAIVAQYEPQGVGSSVSDNGSSMEGTVEGPAQAMKLTALQLSTEHSTSIEEEIIRIKNEHPDDSQCIVNNRVKGRLKVTRAFGAGFLKQPKWNDMLLEMFKTEYIGTAPYISCSPSLCHYRLCPRDQFLVLSSDGLYQYLTNQEVVSHVEKFMEQFPDGDPAQNLIKELLSRAAKKAGMDFHELLDIPYGDRRKYHDDVTVMVISLEGRIWKSSGKCL
ncbi:hypothetical protein K2173_016941 [Erythroxylum novogranatense]|uniref:protein-serine/threonine phosphatase n=1 Tax=Erythroxylum novogranatense TaxID=1862640 RepID=A0AAV8U977_9ROSI|nr:hypothetical protein K2173_016941 [Erythroxylum novogranatense]